MDQCPPSTPPLNCRPITLEKAVTVKPTQKNLCRNYVVWILISVDIMFLQTRHQFLVTCKHAALGFSSAGSLCIVAMKMESGDIWQLFHPSFPFVFTLFHTFSPPSFNFFLSCSYSLLYFSFFLIPPLSPFFTLLQILVSQSSGISSVNLPSQEDHRIWKELNLPVVFQSSWQLSVLLLSAVPEDKKNKK